jgi:hypothetical protein
MISQGNSPASQAGSEARHAADIDVKQLVVDVYESAPTVEKNHMVAQLVGRVYEAAPPAERSRLIAHLLMPLGVLSLAAVANGIFANIRFRSTWPDMQVRLEDAQAIHGNDVTALVNSVQEVSLQAVDSLAQMVSTSPVLAGSAAAAVLVTLLVKRAKSRRSNENYNDFLAD